jgi:glycosyltransferase involved in cell wall biosynthesis
LTDALEAIKRHSLEGEDCSIGIAKLPKVSIVITNYNYAPYLKECIDSCLAQDYQYCEVIVVDDCSGDNSRDIYNTYEGRIKIVEREKNGGQLAAFFSGFDIAGGEFVVFVDADDFLDSDAISAHLYIHLFKSPPVAFSCVRNRQVSANSAIINNYHMDFQANGQRINNIRPRVIRAPTWSWSTTSAMMFRSDTVRLIRTDNTEPFRVCADYYIVHFSNLLGGSMLFDVSKANYRRHGKNNFSKNMVIGGHKPTGHMKLHGHPEHESLQKAILSKLILERECFESYFGSYFHFAFTIAMVAEKEFVTSNFTVDRELKNMLGKVDRQVRSKLIWMLWSKKAGVEIGKLNCYFAKIKNVENYHKNTFCES